jgi:hypothetical protein
LACGNDAGRDGFASGAGAVPDGYRLTLLYGVSLFSQNMDELKEDIANA